MKKVHLIGNAHLDPVWLWRWQEGFAEIKATFQSALDRMNEFDDFQFTSACGAYYMWIEQSDPAMFAEIQNRVREGRWCLVGGWFLQPDCNTPCGESFARHALITQRYFEEKFGRMAVTGYNVDSFGHNGSLPQILRQSRMENYVFMRPMSHEKKLPQNLFLWESRDGSQVMTYRIPFCYNIGHMDLFEKIENNGEDTDQMAFYGVGNHGGGPTVELLKKMHEKLSENYVYSHPDAFFAQQDAAVLPVVKDDLQFHAKGCYSAMLEIKKNNRATENALLRAEKFSILSEQLMRTPYPAAEYERAWKNVLFNQFHDILGGCSIREAYDDARNFHGEALAIADRSANFALQQISWNIDTIGNAKVGSAISQREADQLGMPVVVFNPLDHEVRGMVQLRSQLYEKVTDCNGCPIPHQTVRDSKIDPGRTKYATLFEACVPAFGYAVYRVSCKASKLQYENPFTVTENSIANAKLRVTFDRVTGEISSLYDLENRKELLAEPTGLVLYDDTKHDTWAHYIESYTDRVPTEVRGTVKVIETGPVRASVRVEQVFGKSKLTRTYSLSPDGTGVEVKVKLDYREEFRILKLRFPLNAKNARAYCKIPFGRIERPTDGTEQHCGDWACITGDGTGLCVATDALHSFDTNENRLSLTVLRSALYADHFAGDLRDEFCEFMEQGEHRFSYCLFPFVSVSHAERISAELQNPFNVIPETFHRGVLSTAFDGISVSPENVIVTAIKKHTDGDGLILRCYECEGRDTDVRFRLFDTAFEAHIPHDAIKTFLIKDGTVTETDFIE